MKAVQQALKASSSRSAPQVAIKPVVRAFCSIPNPPPRLDRAVQRTIHLSRRPISTTPVHRNTSAGSSSSNQVQSSSKDPSHPNLYYHFFSSRIALSFLPHPPIYGSSTILGYLPLVSSRGLSDFQEEPKFSKVLHRCIKEGLEKGVAETVDFEASTRPVDGYITLTDERAVPPAGRIGETEDLIASVFVQDGKVVPSTYEPLPSYRLVTPNGPLVLPRGLDKYLVTALEKIDVEEKAQQ